MEAVTIETKNNPSDLYWKKKDGSLVLISSLTDEEVIAARKLSCELADKNFAKSKRAEFEVKKYNDISNLYSNLLEALDEELAVRKEKAKEILTKLELAEKEI